MRRIALFGLAAVALLGACRDSSQPVAPPLDVRASMSPGFPADRYIVVLSPQTADPDGEAGRLTSKWGGRLDRVYRHALKGYVAEMTDQQAAQLRRETGVQLVEKDAPVWASTTQTNATWGLDRIDQHNLPLNGTYTYTVTGAGVNVYVIDSGIRASHVEFGGRANGVFTSINDGNGTFDCAGHGTHVAGTIGGSTYGVAKGVSLHAVRVLDCSGTGSVSGVIAGIDWVTANAVPPAVANMSLGGSASSALDAAVTNSIASGVVYAVSAGNNGVDACTQSPARAAAALTVAATNSSDSRPSWSNRGTCVDLFAPGVSITSAYNTSNTAIAVASGTSMASPHVAGVAALYLEQNPASSAGQVASAIVSNATTGVVGNPGSGSPNRLLYSGFLASSPTLNLAIVSGNNQTAQVGQTLSRWSGIRVTDGNGNGVQGVPVTFRVTSGGGTLDRYQANTGEVGRAYFKWTLGPTPGTQTVEASIAGAPPVTFTATATSPQPTLALSIFGGNNQTAQVGQPLPAAVGVLVTDGGGTPQQGVTVTFAAKTGGGSASPAQAQTDAQGRAWSNWTLGATQGTQTLEASVSGVAPVTFTATATAPPPQASAVLTIIAGNNQTAQTGQTLAQWSGIRLTDGNGTPLSGTLVTFTVTSGGGTLDRYQAYTGEVGGAYFKWTLGPTTGTQTVEVNSAGAQPVTFTATATAPPSQPTAILTIHSGNNQTGAPGQTLPKWSGIRLTDGNGTPLVGTLVTFTVTSGGGTLDRYQAYTGEVGGAYFKW
ncbi:MAG: S8 family serine peptidase, partial [Gemmatimonadota bacterium]